MRKAAPWYRRASLLGFQEDLRRLRSGDILVHFGRIFGLLGEFWALLELSWPVLEASWAILEASSGILAPSWHIGHLLDASGEALGADSG